jgi:hypothetical protein
MSEWREYRELEEIERALNRIEAKLDKLLAAIIPPQAQSATLYISDLKGNRLMPATLVVGATAQAVYQEWSGLNGTGGKMASAGPVAFASSDATVATVDPASGLITAVGPGSATITGSDATNGLSASDVVSDTPVVALSATLTIVPTGAPPATAAK